MAGTRPEIWKVVAGVETKEEEEEEEEVEEGAWVVEGGRGKKETRSTWVVGRVSRAPSIESGSSQANSPRASGVAVAAEEEVAVEVVEEEAGITEGVEELTDEGGDGTG